MQRMKDLETSALNGKSPSDTSLQSSEIRTGRGKSISTREGGEQQETLNYQEL